MIEVGQIRLTKSVGRVIYRMVRTLRRAGPKKNTISHRMNAIRKIAAIMLSIEFTLLQLVGFFRLIGTRRASMAQSPNYSIDIAMRRVIR